MQGNLKSDEETQRNYRNEKFITLQIIQEFTQLRVSLNFSGYMNNKGDNAKGALEI